PSGRRGGAAVHPAPLGSARRASRPLRRRPGRRQPGRGRAADRGRARSHAAGRARDQGGFLMLLLAAILLSLATVCAVAAPLVTHRKARLTDGPDLVAELRELY